MMNRSTLVVVGLVFLVGCGKDGGGEPEKSGGGAAKSGEAAGDPNVWKALELPKLGLVAQAPGNAKVSATGGIETSDYKCSLGVYETKDSSTSFDNWVSNIESGNKGGALKTMVKKDKTDDTSWVLQWDTETGKFGYAARRKVGDKTYDCVAFQSKSAEARDCSIKICESLTAK